MRLSIFALLLPAALSVPALAVDQPPAAAPSPAAREADAVRDALDEARILRAVNRVQLSAEQAGAGGQMLDGWGRPAAVAERRGGGGGGRRPAGARAGPPPPPAAPPPRRPPPKLDQNPAEP